MKIVIYSKNNCQFCTKAKELVKNLGLEYEERKMEDFASLDVMLEDIGKKVKSMPQVKIDDELVGGYNQLLEFFVEEGKINFEGKVL
jgi:glutaredoxin|tara:strand:+ start:104 stop:364 length:261 start_codon:yes stop_codon:yes gene_type:complete